MRLWENCYKVVVMCVCKKMPLVGFSFLEEALHGVKKGAIFQIIGDSKGFLMSYSFPVITSFIEKFVKFLCIPTIVIPS